MTDKEKIIIDGVNVSQCKYLNTFTDCDGYHYYCDLADDIKNEYCEHYKNCYFKQLKRKEQECEKYEKALDEILAITKGLVTDCDPISVNYRYIDINNNVQKIVDIINKAKGKNNGQKI